MIPPHTCIYFGVNFQSHIDDLLFPLHFLMHVNPPPVFARDLRVVPDGPMFFCALRKIAGSLRGRTSIISLIISHWADIHWEGDMFHDMSEINLCFSHFRRN